MTGSLAALFAPVIKAAALAAYPVGSIYMSMDATSPQTLFGGTWTAIAGQFLLGASGAYPAGSTGGEAAHVLTVSEMPAHQHSTERSAGWPIENDTGSEWDTVYSHNTSPHTMWVQGTGSAGGGAAHNNMPPYVAVYMWRRTA